MFPANRIGRAGAVAALFLSLLSPAVASASITHARVDATGPGGRALIAPGDSVSILETVHNSGSSTVSGLNGTLSSTTTGVTVPGNLSTYPTLLPGDDQPNDQPFTATIPSSLPCGASVDFSLRMGGGSSDSIGFTVSTGMAGPVQSFPTLDGPLNIPEGTTVSSLADVSSAGRIKGLRVHIDSLAHPSDRDMNLVLVGPDSTRATLLSTGQLPTGPSNFNDTVFAQSGPAITSGNAPFTGTFRAAGDLSRFIGKEQQGQWRLELRDGITNGLAGVLDGWSLEINPPVCTPVAQAGFTATPNPVRAGSTAAFDATASQDPERKLAHYEWDFGDGSAPVDTATPTVSHPYATRGRKTVTLKMKDASNVLLSQASVNLFVDQPPVAALSAPARINSIDDAVNLDASASAHDPAGSIASYAWDLDGNGTYETPGGTTPTLTTRFTTSGPHTLRVKVTDDVGAASVAVATVVVDNLAPVASFTGPAGWVGSGRPVAFDATASSDRDGAIATYQWDFDDDRVWDTQPLPGPNTSYAFPTAGDRTVRLRVVDNGTPAGSATTTQLVRVTDPPAVTLSVSQNPVPKSTPVTLDTAGSSDDGSIARWDWDLDGDTIFELQDAQPAQTLSYSTYGTRNVQVRATDDHGVTTVRTIALVVANRAPVAALTATPNPVQTGQTVTLDASGSSDAEGPIATYAWDLDGNGSFETGPSASPTATASFPNAGHVDVKVKVTDSDGGSAIAAAGLTIQAPPPPPPTGDGNPAPTGDGAATGGTTSNPGATPAPTTPGATTPGATTPGGAGGDVPAGAFSAGLSGASVQSLKLVLRKGIGLVCQVDRPATCTVSLTIPAASARQLKIARVRGRKPVVIGTATFKAEKAGAAKMTVRLKPSAAKRLRQTRRLLVQVSGTARASNGSTVKLTRGFLLRG